MASNPSRIDVDNLTATIPLMASYSRSLQALQRLLTGGPGRPVVAPADNALLAAQINFNQSFNVFTEQMQSTLEQIQANQNHDAPAYVPPPNNNNQPPE